MKPLSKPLFLIGILVPAISSTAFDLWYIVAHPDNMFARIGSPVFSTLGLFAYVLYLLFVYRMWEVLQDGKVRISPLLASLPLLVPIFEIYWIFVALLGWRKELHKYLERNSLHAPETNRWLLLTFCITGAISSMEIFGYFIDSDAFTIVGSIFEFLGFSLLGFIVTECCDVVNALIRQDRPEKALTKLSGKQRATVSILLGLLAVVFLFAMVFNPSFKESRGKHHAEMAVNSMQAISQAMEYYRNDHNAYPQAIADLIQGEYLSLDPTTTTNWEFSLSGNPVTKIQAKSTVTMPGGKGRLIFYDIERKTFTGYEQ